MDLTTYSAGIAHLGIPTNDIEKTVAFYQNLGFTLALRTVNQAAEEAVAFLQLGNLILEIYENHAAAGTAGAIDHVALAVTDVDTVFQALKCQGFTLLDTQVQFLPFWENGVRFFTILGPNNEKIEFIQKL